MPHTAKDVDAFTATADGDDDAGYGGGVDAFPDASENANDGGGSQKARNVKSVFSPMAYQRRTIYRPDHLLCS